MNFTNSLPEPEPLQWTVSDELYTPTFISPLRLLMVSLKLVRLATKNDTCET